MSAAYYDFYGEEGSSFIVKINMLDKFNNQVCLYRPNGDRTTNYIDVPTELAAIGYDYVYKIEGTLRVCSTLECEQTSFLFEGDSFGNLSSGSGKLFLKCRGDDHNLVIYYTDVELGKAGTYFYDFELKYTKGAFNSTTGEVTATSTTNTLRVLQGRFIIIPKVKQGT